MISSAMRAMTISSITSPLLACASAFSIVYASRTMETFRSIPRRHVAALKMSIAAP